MSRSTGELASYLSDILVWGDRLAAHLAGMTAEAFQESPEKVDAVCWCLSCIGEAAGRVRQGWPKFAADHPEIEFARAYALRNRIAHGYQALDVGLVWSAATVSLPALIAAVRSSADAG